MSEPAAQGIYLIVRYHGAKAAQHFSNEFTPLASSVFRQDLSNMKFPHPKIANTRLIHDATVMAWWPDVSQKTHGVLYNHLQKNTNTALSSGLLAQLSILLVSVMEIEEEGKEPRQLAFVSDHLRLSPTEGLPPAKRARLDDTPHSSIQVSQPPLRPISSTVPAAGSSSGSRSSISVSQSRSVAAAPASQSATATTSQAQKRSWDGQIVPSNLPTQPPATSSFPLLPPRRVLPSTPLHRTQVPAPSTHVQAMHNLPPKPSASLPPPSQNTSLAALNVQGTLATRPAFNVVGALTAPSGLPLAHQVPVSPAQAVGHQITRNHEPTQSPAPTSTPTPTQPRPLNRTQASSPLQQGRPAAPAPQNGVASKPIQGKPKPSRAQTPLTRNNSAANSAQPTLTTRGMPAIWPPSNRPDVLKTHPPQVTQGAPATPLAVPRVQAVLPTSASATQPLAPLGRAAQISPQKQQNHQRQLTQLSPALAPTPTVPQTLPPATPQQQRSTYSSLSNQPNQRSSDTELEALRKRVKSMEEMLRKQLDVKVRLDETSNKLQDEQEARKKLEKMAAVLQESEAGAKRRLEELQKLYEDETRRRSEADDLLAATQRDAMSYREMYDQAKEERDEFARGCDRLHDELSFSRRNEVAAQDEVDRALQKIVRMEQELQEETDRRRRYQDRLASAKRNEAALKLRCDEAAQEVASLRRVQDQDAQDAIAVKRRDDEALRLSEEEKLDTQQIVMQQAENAMHAAQSSEKALRRRLEEAENRLEEVHNGLEMELAAERKLRREAEDAIADIRRECKEPFVVPSLLDAFVELAKMTTAATTSDGLAIGTSKRNLENKNSGDYPPTMDSAMDAVSGDARPVVASAEWALKQESSLSPHPTQNPRSP